MKWRFFPEAVLSKHYSLSSLYIWYIAFIILSLTSNMYILKSIFLIFTYSYVFTWRLHLLLLFLLNINNHLYKCCSTEIRMNTALVLCLDLSYASLWYFKDILGLVPLRLLIQHIIQMHFNFSLHASDFLLPNFLHLFQSSLEQLSCDMCQVTESFCMTRTRHCPLWNLFPCQVHH